MPNSSFNSSVKFGSIAEATEAVRESATRVASIAAYIRASRERNELNLALHNLTDRTSRELLRLAKNHDQGLDLLAWCTRNVFELNLLVRFVLLNEENAGRFLAEAAMDEQQILEGFLSISNSTSKEEYGIIERRIAEIDELAAIRGIKLLKPIQTSKLAEIVGCADEYVGMFKFMSKYVHPSSWLVNKPVIQTDNYFYWDILVVHAQLYAMDSYERTRKALKIPESV